MAIKCRFRLETSKNTEKNTVFLEKQSIYYPPPVCVLFVKHKSRIRNYC